MRADTILNRVAVVEIIGDVSVSVKSLAHSAADVKKDTMFFCINGTNHDGHDFACEAVKNGASVIVAERRLDVNVPQIIVRNTRRAMAVIAQNFYGNPAERLKLIAVTGTNGKTSVSFMVKAILERAGKQCGVIGTNGVYFAGKREDCGLTTPDPIAFFSILARMVDCGVEYVAFEASAHAIALKKLDGFTVDVGIFTNLSQDHLDFFGSMEEYGRIKKSFFTGNHMRGAVVNADDALGMEIIKSQTVPVISYGAKNPSDVFFVRFCEKESRSSYLINFRDRLMEIDTALTGKFNAYNALAAACACYLMGIKIPIIAQGINEMLPIEGRNNLVYVKGVRCVVDFAHTPDGIRNILSYLKSITQERLITVFGCGGDRDRDKRSKMGNVASRYSDLIILTEDNSRSERTEDIIQDISDGIYIPYKIVTDRKAAIRSALNEATVNDTVAILGKGAEREIISSKGNKPHNDFEYLKELTVGKKTFGKETSE